MIQKRFFYCTHSGVHVLLGDCLCYRYLPPLGALYRQKTTSEKWHSDSINNLEWFLFSNSIKKIFLLHPLRGACSLGRDCLCYRYLPPPGALHRQITFFQYPNGWNIDSICKPILTKKPLRRSGIAINPT